MLARQRAAPPLSFTLRGGERTHDLGVRAGAGAFAALANPERHAKILVEPARA